MLPPAQEIPLFRNDEVGTEGLAYQFVSPAFLEEIFVT